MRIEGKQARCLESKVIRRWGSWNNKWLISFLVITCWLKPNACNGKWRGFSWKVWESGGPRNGNRGKRSSCFSENIRCMYVPVSWQVGSVAEGQMSFVRAEWWSGGSDPTVWMQKNTPNCTACYSGVLVKWMPGTSWGKALPKSYSFLAHTINSSGKMWVAFFGRFA